MKRLATILTLIGIAVLVLPAHATDDFEFSNYSTPIVYDRNFKQFHKYGSARSYWFCSQDTIDSEKECTKNTHYKRIGKRSNSKGISVGKANSTVMLYATKSALSKYSNGRLIFEYRMRGRNPSKKKSTIRATFEGDDKTETHTGWLITPRKKTGWRKVSINFNSIPQNLHTLAIAVDNPKRNHLNLQLRNIKFVSNTMIGTIYVEDVTAENLWEADYTVDIYNADTNELEETLSSNSSSLISFSSSAISPGEKDIVIHYNSTEYRTSHTFKRTHENTINLYN